MNSAAHARALSPEPFPAPWASDWGEDPVGLWQSLTYRDVRQAFRWCPPGRFLMGSPENEHERNEGEIRHPVMLTRGFWLAETVCTQALWQTVMGDDPRRPHDESRPVGNVSWEDAQRFIARLNEELAAFEALHLAVRRPDRSRGHVPGPEEPAIQRLRLPTEAEWEYACRAGTTVPFSFGDDISPDQTNFDGNRPYRGNRTGLYRQQTVEVATLPPNPWGLYEMHGNVWEWCQDWYGEYPTSGMSDPTGPAIGEGRVLRGGSWIDGARRLRSAYRARDVPGYRSVIYGFRLALGPELGQAGETSRERDRTARARSER